VMDDATIRLGLDLVRSENDRMGLRVR
jgi:hypothetical protein